MILKETWVQPETALRIICIPVCSLPSKLKIQERWVRKDSCHPRSWSYHSYPVEPNLPGRHAAACCYKTCSQVSGQSIRRILPSQNLENTQLHFLFSLEALEVSGQILWKGSKQKQAVHNALTYFHHSVWRCLKCFPLPSRPPVCLQLAPSLKDVLGGYNSSAEKTSAGTHCLWSKRRQEAVHTQQETQFYPETRTSKNNIGLGSGCGVMCLHEYSWLSRDSWWLIQAGWTEIQTSVAKQQSIISPGPQWSVLHYTTVLSAQLHPFKAVAFDIDAPCLRSLTPEFCNVPIGGVDTFLGTPRISMRSFQKHESSRKVAKRHRLTLLLLYISIKYNIILCSMVHKSATTFFKQAFQTLHHSPKSISL